jgi:hypothetical protein
VKAIHPGEIHDLVLNLTGADEVIVSAGAGLRFGERSKEAQGRSNARPARFIHVDVSDTTARLFAERQLAEEPGGLSGYRRFAHYNVWRSFSPPPQDVPLAVCDFRSVEAGDLLRADAMFDDPNRPGAPPIFSFEGVVLHYNPAHRWAYFSDMTRDGALVFKTFDSDPTQPSFVPHTGFDDPSCPPGAVPRASIEMRAIAYFRD